MRLQQALVLVQFLRQVDEVMFWISDKETFVTADEFGHDLEHVEVRVFIYLITSFSRIFVISFVNLYPGSAAQV